MAQEMAGRSMASSMQAIVQGASCGADVGAGIKVVGSSVVEVGEVVAVVVVRTEWMTRGHHVLARAPPGASSGGHL